MLRDLRVIAYWKLTMACSISSSRKKGHKLISKDDKKTLRKMEDSLIGKNKQKLLTDRQKLLENMDPRLRHQHDRKYLDFIIYLPCSLSPEPVF